MTGGIQAVLQESVQYALQSQLIGAQIDEITKNIDVKERTVTLQETESADKLLTSAKQRILLDEEKETADKNQLLLDLQNAIETYKKDTLLPDEHSINLEKINSITKDIDVKERSTVVQEKESYIKRVAEDKTAALLGLDNVVKTLNATPEEVYTIKYKEV